MVTEKLTMNVAIWNLVLKMMKAVLREGEYKFGRETEDFKHFKKRIMDEFYGSAYQFFSESDDFEKCECKSSMRQGWNKNCDVCNGSGFKMKG